MAVTRMVEEVGRVLGGRYRVLAPIGRGASAQVFLADDVRLRRRVAVKMLHPALADDVDFLRRFQAEAQAAAALNHPHVLSVFDWGQDGEIPYLVTEYLGGGSLRTMLDQQRLLTQSQALVVGLEASRGLDYAHRRGLVHRDIKPANLLFGDDGRLRIADFGLARALAEAAWTEPQGAVLGTARYASPEQAQGQTLTGRADVYSLALVLVEAVTGRVPFSADTTIGTLMARIDRPLEVPSALGPLRGALEEAGRPQPDDRLDARALTGALMRAAERLPRPQSLPLAGAIVVEPTAESDLDPTAHAPSARSLEPTPAEPTRAEPAPSPSPVDPDLTQPETPMPLASFPRFGPGTDTEALPAASPAEPPGPRRARRLRRRLAVLGVALMVIAVAAAVVFANDGTSPPETHRVPDVVGETEAAARQELEPLGWKVAERTERRDDTEAGQVISTDPAPGGLLAEGRDLTLIISDGAKTREVPTDLRGKTRAQAVNQLKYQEFVPTVRETYDEEIEAGLVMGVERGTPERVDRGGEVPLVVSTGPKPRIVPSGLPGLPVEQAVEQLAAIQLKDRVNEVYSDSTPEGIVITTDTPGGTEVPRGATISLDVSRGPIPVPVPDVRQVETLQEAFTLLEQAGFKPGTVRGPAGGRPARTIPQRGTLLAKGSTVDINMR